MIVRPIFRIPKIQGSPPEIAMQQIAAPDRLLRLLRHKSADFEDFSGGYSPQIAKFGQICRFWDDAQHHQTTRQ